MHQVSLGSNRGCWVKSQLELQAGQSEHNAIEIDERPRKFFWTSRGRTKVKKQIKKFFCIEIPYYGNQWTSSIKLGGIKFTHSYPFGRIDAHTNHAVLSFCAIKYLVVSAQKYYSITQVLQHILQESRIQSPPHRVAKNVLAFLTVLVQSWVRKSARISTAIYDVGLR